MVADSRNDLEHRCSCGGTRREGLVLHSRRAGTQIGPKEVRDRGASDTGSVRDASRVARQRPDPMVLESQLGYVTDFCLTHRARQDRERAPCTSPVAMWCARNALSQAPQTDCGHERGPNPRRAANTSCRSRRATARASSPTRATSATSRRAERRPSTWVVPRQVTRDGTAAFDGMFRSIAYQHAS